MTSRLGENMQREWDLDPLATELWDALQLRKHDRVAGNADLTMLAERGSALAMMYLGHDYVRGGGRAQIACGEQWLIQSATAGSIEGRLQLARHYEQQGAWAKAIVELGSIADQGYTPAHYFLAHIYYKGDTAHRSVRQAIIHLRLAVDAGHLPSMGLLSQVYRKERLGLSARIASHWLCLTKLPALVRLMWSYPSSDLLRPFGPDFRVRSKAA